MNDDEEKRDDAIGRLGGPSRLTELTQEYEVLKQRTDDLVTWLAFACVCVGAELDPGLAAVTWYDELGRPRKLAAASFLPRGQPVFRVEGLGHNWCVIRASSDALYFTAVPPDTDIRHDLAPGIFLPGLR